MDGGKQIAVLDENGKKIGSFNIPTDNSIAKRYAENLSKYKNTFIPLRCINITADGRAANKSGKKILANAENKIYALFDEIIGYEGASKAFFSEVHPFAKVKGKFYCDQCLHLIKQCINSQIGGK